MITTYGESLARAGLAIGEYRHAVAFDCINDHWLHISFEDFLCRNISIENAVEVKKFFGRFVSDCFFVKNLPL